MLYDLELGFDSLGCEPNEADGGTIFSFDAVGEDSDRSQGGFGSLERVHVDIYFAGQPEGSKSYWKGDAKVPRVEPTSVTIVREPV